MILYSLGLFFYCLLIAPKLFWDRVFFGKKHPAFLQRLGFYSHTITKKKVIWVHAVSVGEVKAVRPFFELLKQNYPKHLFFLSTTTFTGQEEAKRSIAADAYFYLPLDFKWVVSRFVKKIRPELFFLTEGDIWPNLLSSIQKEGGKTILISGKISERSFLRMKRFSWISRKLFSNLDLICAQSPLHASRFAHFAPNIVHVTGNLKFDMKKEPIKEDLGSYITISCTHAPEEEMLLEQFIKCPWTIFLAPRHPERFIEVENLLIRKKISFSRFSEKKTGDVINPSHEKVTRCLLRQSKIDCQIAGQYSRTTACDLTIDFAKPQQADCHLFGARVNKVILVDEMGVLGFCYSKSIMAILGGSFVKGIGGHNLLEPALYGCPTLFGPYMEGQKEIVHKVLEAKAGLQRPFTAIWEAAQEIALNRKDFSKRSLEMVDTLRGASDLTFQAISKKG